MIGYDDGQRVIVAFVAHAKARAEAAETERDALRARLETEEELLRDVLALIDEQAEDDALWFVADSIVEAFLQQELRRLTAAIEEPARAFVARNVA